MLVWFAQWQSGNTISVTGHSGTNNVMTVITGQALIVSHSSCSNSLTHTKQRCTHRLGWMHTTHELTDTACTVAHYVNHTSRISASAGHWDVYYIISLLVRSTVFFLLVPHLVLYLSSFPFSLIAGFRVVIQCLSLPSPLLEQGDNYRVSKLRGDAHQHL